MNSKLKAEELMRAIEKEEERAVLDNPNAKNYHLCIVNLVIGYELGFFKTISFCKYNNL